MKIIYKKFDKTAINSLPRAMFPGKITTITRAEDTEDAVNYLLSQDILGVDTETRPSFAKGHMHAVSLLQVSSRDTCYLFRLHLTGMTPAIIRLLEDQTVPKVGLSWHDDLAQLHRKADFTPGNFIELQNEVGKIGIEDMSLQKLYANLFHEKISKGQRLSNWEAGTLKDAQLMYAATDAWTCINLYEEICRLKETHDYELVEEEEELTSKTDNKTELKAEAKTEPKAETKTKPKAKAKKSPKAESKTKPKTKPRTKPKAKTKTKPKAESAAE